MERYGKLYKIITVVVFLAIGCVITVGRYRNVDFQKMIERHSAVKMHKDGNWDLRYEKTLDDNSNDSGFCAISVNVNREMTHDDMLTIIDYYYKQYNAKFVGESYKGSGRLDVYKVYAIFYEGSTDKEICRLKTENGEETDITDEDENYVFSTIQGKTLSEDERGENGI